MRSPQQLEEQNIHAVSSLPFSRVGESANHRHEKYADLPITAPGSFSQCWHCRCFCCIGDSVIRVKYISQFVFSIAFPREEGVVLLSTYKRIYKATKLHMQEKLFSVYPFISKEQSTYVQFVTPYVTLLKTIVEETALRRRKKKKENCAILLSILTKQTSSLTFLPWSHFQHLTRGTQRLS